MAEKELYELILSVEVMIQPNQINLAKTKNLSSQWWKNLGVQRIITPHRNVLADICDYLADNFGPPPDNFDLLTDKNVHETFLRGLMICCTPRFFHHCVQCTLLT